MEELAGGSDDSARVCRNVIHKRADHPTKSSNLKLYLPPTQLIKLKNLYIYTIRALTPSMPNNSIITAS